MNNKDYMFAGVNEAIKTIESNVENGKSFHDFMFHPNEIVRAAVAGNVDPIFYGGDVLDVLMFDKSSKVRVVVAKQGYKMDIMCNDPNPNVRVAVVYSLAKGIKESNAILRKVRDSPTNEDDNYTDIINIETSDIERNISILTKLSTDLSPKVRIAVAENGYCLEILINDKSPRVRAAVAKHQYNLDILISDNNWMVRKQLALNGYKLDILIKDRNPYVRAAVASMGYGLDILVDDPDPIVRTEVAHQNYDLEKLLNDDDSEVRREACRQSEVLKYKENYDVLSLDIIKEK